MWNLLLLLREIVELVRTVNITVDMVAIMNDIIEQYIEERVNLFPADKLKPKHHYLTHYAILTLECSSLIRLWILRFESKLL